MAQSVPPPIEYTGLVTANAKTLRGTPAVLAALATVALHALLLEQVMNAGGPSQPTPATASVRTLRIEMLPTQSSVPEQVAAIAQPRAAADAMTREAESALKPRAPAPLPPALSERPPLPASDPSSVLPDGPAVAVGADEFSTSSIEPGGLGGRQSEGGQADPLASGASEASPDPGPAVAEGSVTDLKNQAEPARSASISLEGRWRYQVFYGEYSNSNQVASLDYVLSIQGDRYRLHTEGQALGLLSLFYRGHFTQVSEGRFDDNGFRSERYEERRGNRAPRVVRIETQGEGRKVSFEDGRTEPTSALAQDRLSLAAQLAWLAARRADRLRDSEVSLPLVGVASIRVLRFVVTPAQMLEMPGGVRQLTRLRSEDGDGERSGSLEIWLSESGDLMPIRIRLEDRNGQVLDQLIATD